MTDSIDAAVAEIPAGFKLALLVADDWPYAPGKWGCEIDDGASDDLSPDDPEFQRHHAHGNGDTAATAIRAAVAALNSQVSA
jgi:hypothetical protein